MVHNDLKAGGRASGHMISNTWQGVKEGSLKFRVKQDEEPGSPKAWGSHPVGSHMSGGSGF